MGVQHGTRRESVERSSRDDVPNHARTRMLLAEDDAELRGLIAAHFRGLGFDVVEARDGYELLRFLRSMDIGAKLADPPDVIVTDARMPESSGPDAVATLRGSNRDIPLILMTASPDAHTDEIASRLGARIVIGKPVDMAELGCAVQAATSR